MKQPSYNEDKINYLFQNCGNEIYVSIKYLQHYSALQIIIYEEKMNLPVYLVHIIYYLLTFFFQLLIT